MKNCKLPLGLVLFLFLFSARIITAQQLDHVLNEALIQLKPGLEVDQLENDMRQINGKETGCRAVRKISKQLNIYKIHFDHLAIDEFEFRDQLARHPDVEIVQVNHLLTKRQTIPDDPQFSNQWHWVNPNDADVDADLAWDITTGGTTANGDEIVIAVFDDGGDLDHPDLIANNWINIHEIQGNGIDDDNNGYIDDVFGWNFQNNNNNVDGGDHGVEVAGMIGGVGNNANQGTGINWSIKIMNIKSNSLQEDEIIEFYAYALDQRERYTNSAGQEGAFVVATNSSWGIDEGDPADAPLWCGFYDTLGEAGILSCGATTNDELDVDVVGDLPTACPSEFMIAVTATNNQDNRTFSGYGATTIDVAAPGAAVYTTRSGGTYTNATGTSFASPLTAGIIGLIYSAPCNNLAALAMAAPQVAAEQVRDALFGGAEMVGNLNGDVVYGRVNAYNSVQIVMDNCPPCPPPVGIQASDVLDVSVNLNWVNPTDFLTNDLQYRVAGAANWITFENVTKPFALTGLTACTEYEVQVAVNCVDDEGGYSNSYFFTTEGCCVAPENLAIYNIENTSASANWAAVFAAESYNLRWRETGAPTWTEMNLSTTNFSFENLIACTIYDVQVQTVCANATTDFSNLVTFSTTGCGACTDLNYCSSEGENVEDEWIGGFILAAINNQTPDAPTSGYSDFTGSVFTTTLSTNATYEVTCTPEHSGFSFSEYFKVYIDYNQDGTFNENDELAFDPGSSSNSTVNGQITIPENALEGLTRLRVVMKYDTAPVGCGSYNYGETEDYCVTIVNGPPSSCLSPSSLDTMNVETSSVNVNWDVADSADFYEVRYKIQTEPNWATVNSSATSIMLIGLSDCTNYEFQVRSVCSNSLSNWSDSFIFKTACLTGTTEIENGLTNLSLSPNPFNNELTSLFQLLESMTLTIEVYGATGQHLARKEYLLGAGSQNIVIPGLDQVSSGVYFVAMRTDKGVMVRRVVKQ